MENLKEQSDAIKNYIYDEFDRHLYTDDNDIRIDLLIDAIINGKIDFIRFYIPTMEK